MKLYFSKLRTQFLTTIVFATIFVVSVINLLVDLNRYLGQLENGNLIQVSSFLFLLVVSGFGLILDFQSLKPLSTPPIPINIQKELTGLAGQLIVFFIEGLNRGYSPKPQLPPLQKPASSP